MKRMIVVSDSHYCVTELKEAFDRALVSGPIDVAVFLGDMVADFKSIRQELEERGTECYAVSGNNDWGSRAPQEVTFQVGKVKFYACHGHTCGVKSDLDRLWFAASEAEAQVALYGHTHQESSIVERGIHLINPGAICNMVFGRGSYAEIRVEDNGAVLPQLIFLSK